MKFSAKFSVFLLILIGFTLSLSGLAQAFTSNSTNYSVNGEFGNFGGAKSSTNFNVTDTGGGFAPGFSNSSNFSNCSGFQCTLARVPSITFTLSTNAVNLGTLTTSAINIQSHTATVTTNLQGYTLTVLQDGNLCRTALPCSSSSPDNDIDSVSPSPTTLIAGTEAFGLATSQSGQTINQYSPSCSSSSQFSAVTTAAQGVANSSSPTPSGGTSTTLCYGATAGGSTTAGTYTQQLTYIATGKF